VPLFDPHRAIADLKHTVAIYPPAMKDAIVRHNLGSGEFTLVCLPKYVARGDVYNTVASVTRVLANLTQALYALNERYFINDKAIAKDSAEFRIGPRDFLVRATRLLCAPGSDVQELQRSLDTLKQLSNEVAQLAGNYRPRF